MSAGNYFDCRVDHVLDVGTKYLGTFDQYTTRTLSLLHS